MSRLPTPGSDDGTWGDILNDFLGVSLNPDGTLKVQSTIDAKYVKPGSGIPQSDLAAAVQDLLFSGRTVSTFQLETEYDANFNAIYVGEAVQGAATSDASWTIQKITYDSSDNPTLIQTADGAWTNRASLTYS